MEDQVDLTSAFITDPSKVNFATEQPKTVETIVEPVVATVIEEKEVINHEFENKEEVEGEENGVAYFAKAIGLEEGDYGDDDTFDSLAKLANQKLSSIEEKYSKFNNPVLDQIADHLAVGGSLEDFISTPQTYDFYTKLTIDEGNVQQQEQILRGSLAEKGIRTSMIDKIIDDAKDNGTLLSEAEEELKILQQLEKQHNDSVTQQREQTLAEQREQYNQWLTGVTKAIDSNNFNGFSIPKEEIDELRKLSIPDKNGNAAINEVYNNLTPEQQILMNHAVLRISKNQPINIVTKNNVASSVGSRSARMMKSANNNNNNLVDLHSIKFPENNNN